MSASVYRLTTANGEGLPFSTIGSPLPPFSAVRGDLMLRDDGTYGLGIASSSPGGAGYTEGRWRGHGATLELSFPAPGGTEADTVWRPAAARGDSLVLELLLYSTPWPSGVTSYPLRLAFRRVPLEPSVVAGRTYALRGANEATMAPFVVIDTTYEFGVREISTVVFDTLQFRDGLFYRQHAEIRSLYTYSDGVQTWSAASWNATGLYEGSGSRIVLHTYGPTPQIMPAGDTLTLEGAELLRRSATPNYAVLHYGRTR